MSVQDTIRKMAEEGRQEQLAKLGARVLEILCGSHVTPRTDAEAVEHIADAIEALGLLSEKGAKP